MTFEVAEILADGHESLDSGRLVYVRDMANRVGFSILDAVPERGEKYFRIALRIDMEQPVFLARLDNEPQSRQ